MRFLLATLTCLLLPAPAVQAEEQPFRIGAMLCQTGNCADWGTAALRGAILAQEEINANGGILSRRIDLIVEDTAESISGARAVSAFQSLLGKDIQYFIGPSWAPGALAIAPVARTHPGILLITPSASAPEFSRTGPQFFNMRQPEESETRVLARYAFEHGKRKAAIFGSQQPAETAQGKIFEEEFKRLGGAVTLRLEPDPALRDLRTEALRIVASSPDVIFLMNYNQLETGAKTLAALGFSGMRMAISLDDARIASAGPVLEGLIVARAAEPSEAFRESFRARFKEPPGLSAEGGYDALKSLAQAIEEAHTFDTSVVQMKLAAGKYHGAVGEFSFNASREVAGAPVLRAAVAGRLVPLP